MQTPMFLITHFNDEREENADWRVQQQRPEQTVTYDVAIRLINIDSIILHVTTIPVFVYSVNTFGH